MVGNHQKTVLSYSARRDVLDSSHYAISKPLLPRRLCCKEKTDLLGWPKERDSLFSHTFFATRLNQEREEKSLW